MSSSLLGSPRGLPPRPPVDQDKLVAKGFDVTIDPSGEAAQFNGLVKKVDLRGDDWVLEMFPHHGLLAIHGMRTYSVPGNLSIVRIELAGTGCPVLGEPIDAGTFNPRATFMDEDLEKSIALAETVVSACKSADIDLELLGQLAKWRRLLKESRAPDPRWKPVNQSIDNVPDYVRLDAGAISITQPLLVTVRPLTPGPVRLCGYLICEPPPPSGAGFFGAPYFMG